MSAREEVMEDVAAQVEDETVENPDVLAKYKMAAEITNAAIAEVIKAIAPGKKVLDLCVLGDDFITRRTADIFKKGKGDKKVEKGIAFPTCVNVNTIVCHFSAIQDDVTIQTGDTVRIDLGTHVDGYIAVAAQTIVVQAAPAPITGKAADALAAADVAASVALALIRPGNKNSDVSAAWAKVAAAYQVNLCEGVLSHQLKRYVIDGTKVILQKPTIEQKTEEHQFEENEVYSVDIVISTGEGKLKETDAKPTIFKRAADQAYSLKTDAGRKAITEVKTRFTNMPFTVRALSDARSRIGIVECSRHNLVDAYPVLYERRGEFVAHNKFTVIIGKSGSLKVTGAATQAFQSAHSIEDNTELKELLSAAAAASASTDKKKKKKKKAAVASTSADASTSAAAEVSADASAAMDTTV